MCNRLERYHRKKEQASQFVEGDDEDSLEFRNSADLIFVTHQENFVNYS